MTNEDFGFSFVWFSLKVAEGILLHRAGPSIVHLLDYLSTPVWLAW